MSELFHAVLFGLVLWVMLWGWWLMILGCIRQAGKAWRGER